MDANRKRQAQLEPLKSPQELDLCSTILAQFAKLGLSDAIASTADDLSTTDECEDDDVKNRD
jgi:histidinol phosphatase-like PHP family hydrolase